MTVLGFRETDVQSKQQSLREERGADRRLKQTTLATGRKGRVDDRKKDWTRKPENPKKRKTTSVRSFPRSVHLSGIKPHLPNLFSILAEITQFRGRK